MADLRNVYDYYSPSPIPLKDLVCMEVALILWRKEIDQNITENGTLRERYPRKKTSLRCLVTELPATVLTKITQHVHHLQIYIPWWLDYHSSQGILNLNVLKHFRDFVFDFNGQLHYGRTAKRFVACKGISDDVKFKMACWYCLEDDILRIWPQVSSRVIANKITFNDKPLFRYWVCRLTNQPLVFDNVTSSIEQLTLEELCDYFNGTEWFCAKYFFNLLSPETRMKHNEAYLLAPERIYEFDEVFFRYMLAKLNEDEFEELVNKYGAELVLNSWEPYNLRIWSSIKNKITVDGFCHLVKSILKDQTRSDLNYEESAVVEFWNSASSRLKQAAIRDALLVVDSSYFDRKYIVDFIPRAEHRRTISFLLAMLSDTPVEDRKKFWKAHWETLYIDIRPADLRCLINLCFDNDQNQIISFKNEIKSKYDRMIRPALKKLLKYGYFEELEEFLEFWCPNERSVKEVRLMLLCDSFIISSEFIGKASSLNEFIEKAFEDAAHATNFKNRFFVSPDNKTFVYLTCCIRHYELSRVMEFVDTFALSDEVKYQIKVHVIMPIFKTSLIKPPVRLIDFLEKNFDMFESFIIWLFESDDEIARFKETLDMDALIQDLIAAQKSSFAQSDYRQLSHWFGKCFETLHTPDDDSGVKKFLKWYFVTAEAVEMFEKKYSHDYVFNRLLL